MKNFFVGTLKWLRSSVAAILAIFLPKAWPSIAKALVGGVSAGLVTLHMSVNPTYVTGGDLFWIPIGVWNDLILYSINALGTYLAVWAVSNKSPNREAKANPVIRTALDVPPK